MHIRSKLVLTGLVAALTMLFVVGSANAGLLSIDDRDFEAIWPSLEFTNEDTGQIVRCPVTLLGSFHRQTISKVARSLIGVVRHVDINRPACQGGTGDPREETLPWHVTYEAFTGTLPTISAVRILLTGAGFDITQTIFGSSVTCRAITSSTENATGTIALNASGQATSITATSQSIDTTDTTGTVCDIFAIDGRFSGVGTVTDLSGNLVFIRLI